MGHRGQRVHDARTRSVCGARAQRVGRGCVVARALAGRPREAGAARAAIVAAADRLFYARGVASVSLEEIAHDAGVTRRTLYYHFAGKEALVGVYLRGRDTSGRALLEGARAANPSPHDRILAVFDGLDRWFHKREFRGCALGNALGEGGENVVIAGTITLRHKRALLAWFERQAAELGASDAPLLGKQLMLLFDGAMTGAATRRDPNVARVAKSAATTLLAAHPPVSRKRFPRG